MNEFFKKNILIIIAFALPILLVMGVAFSVYLPSLFLSTQYNFVYAVCTDGRDYYSYNCHNYYQKYYTVVNGELVVNEVDPTADSDGDKIPDAQENYTARLFLHNTKTNESREITLEEAKRYELSSLITSPDGVTVTNRYERGPDILLLIDGGSESGVYLTKGKSKSKLNLIYSNQDYYYYRNSFQFIGWVLRN